MFNNFLKVLNGSQLIVKRPAWLPAGCGNRGKVYMQCFYRMKSLILFLMYWLACLI